MRATRVIPVLSGHVGGANAMSERIADLLGATPVLTTASDVGKTIPVDIWAGTWAWPVPTRSTSPAYRPMWSTASPLPWCKRQAAPWWTRPTPLPADVECRAALRRCLPITTRLCGSPMGFARHPLVRLGRAPGGVPPACGAGCRCHNGLSHVCGSKPIIRASGTCPCHWPGLRPGHAPGYGAAVPAAGPGVGRWHAGRCGGAGEH